MKNWKKSILHIEKVVCSYYGLEPWELAQRTRKQDVLEPRQVASLLMRATGVKLKYVMARYKQNHATIVNSVRRQQGYMAVMPDSAFRIRSICERAGIDYDVVINYKIKTRDDY